MSYRARRGYLMSLVATTILVIANPSWAAGPCDRLSAPQKKVAAKIFANTYPYDCCDEKLSVCLKQRKVCRLAKRLRDSICRHLKKNRTEKQIRGIISRRARSMTPMGKKASFKLATAPPAGDSAAKVQVVVYACARCPYCSKVVPTLYDLVTRGGLKGKVRVHFRPFPIRSHKGSVEGGLAFVAAAKLGKAWPYIKKLYAKYDDFAANKLAGWATEIGLDRAKFTKLIRDSATRKQLVKDKKEGIRNKVNATPTLFINGRKYFGELDRATLLDVLDEEHDRLNKRQFCDGAFR